MAGPWKTKSGLCPRCADYAYMAGRSDESSGTLPMLAAREKKTKVHDGTFVDSKDPTPYVVM